ncbi:MAG: hypothetical protein K2P51_01480 [Rhabdochlamydiaceae bacterium]|nr:hypothetical protein [Rhabdochlamydiaceae bacterium]
MCTSRQVSFSPFSSHTVSEDHNRSLLLQFILNELFSLYTHLSQDLALPSLVEKEARILPFDWALEQGPLNRMSEYLSMLPLAFPQRVRLVKSAQKCLNALIHSLRKKNLEKDLKIAQLKNLHQIMEQLIAECEEDENLSLFLLKHKQQIDQLMGNGYLRDLLLRLYPQGLRSLEEMVCDHYHERGFFSLIPELKDLIALLEVNE